MVHWQGRDEAPQPVQPASQTGKQVQATQGTPKPDEKTEQTMQQQQQQQQAQAARLPRLRDVFSAQQKPALALVKTEEPAQQTQPQTHQWQGRAHNQDELNRQAQMMQPQF